MKFIHLSDLHLGKRLNEFSLIEDQQHILLSIISIIDSEKPDAVFIAGDVYDKSVPSAEAVEMFDEFITKLVKRKVSVFIISGNHDSAERIAFGGRIMCESGVYLSPVYNGTVEPVKLSDGYGTVNIYLMPFVKPVHVRRFYEDEVTDTYTDALRVAINAMDMNESERNILIAHQFVTGASVAGSEEKSVGGLDNVDAAVFDAFDYVALGHIHGAQDIGSGNKIRYCGTPLKYSFSEASHVKSVTVGELKEKGTLEIRTVPLVPKRDMVVLKGRYDELMAKSFYEGTTYCTDYVQITLTDEDDIPDAIGKLRTVYKNLMSIKYDNERTRSSSEIEAVNAENKTPVELFSDFFKMQNSREMYDDEYRVIKDIVEHIWEGQE